METDWNLLAKYVQGESSPEEKQQLLAWVQADPAHQALLEKAQQAWLASSDVYQAYTPDTERAWRAIDRKISVPPVVSMRPKTSRRGTDRRWWLRVAAALVLLAGLAYLIPYVIPPGGFGLAEVRTEAYQTRELLLADGTRVWLNGSTTLRYPKSFDGPSRNVYLTGEAYFDVARNEAQPFLIESGEVLTRVLGTSFNVQAVPQDTAVVVTVVSGTVALTSEANEQPTIILQQGEQGAYSTNRQQVRKTMEINQNTLAWRTRRMVFANQLLSDVSQVLEEAYQRKVVVDPAVADLKLTAQFDDQPLKEVLEVIGLTLDISYQVSSNTVYFWEIEK